MNKNDTKYDLTEEEFNRSLIMAESVIFMGKKSAKNPISIFVVAQPGAGKSGLRSYAVNEAQQDNGSLETFIEFNPDEIAAYHQHYHEILKEFPDNSHQILQRFVAPALDDNLRQRAVELRYNIVQEGTFRSTDGYIKLMDFQKNGGQVKVGDIKPDGTRTIKTVKGGYNIDVNILAVDRFESLLSAYEREQEDRNKGFTARIVTPDNHDCSYEKMLETIRVVENRKLYNRMRVFKRGYIRNKPELVYVSGDKRYSSIVEAVVAERAKNRKELLSNPKAYLDRISKLRKQAQKTGPNPKQIERINRIEEEFNLELEKEKEK